jgi:metallo-beta-lactamase class B
MAEKTCLRTPVASTPGDRFISSIPANTGPPAISAGGQLESAGRRGEPENRLPRSLPSMKSLYLVLVLSALASTAVADPAEWTEPFPAHKIAGNLYYVGSKDLASYLVATPEGHILINSSLESSVPLIRASVEKLGFRFADVKFLLISHAHSDHCAGSAEILKQTNAQYCVMAEDAEAVENGGPKRSRLMAGYLQFPPAKVDRRLKDGDTVSLGGSTLTARLTPGHTPGCTTWTMDVAEGGRTLKAVIIGSPNVNPGYRLVNNTDYPRMATDYERTFAVLKALPVDLFLGAHGGYYGMTEKHAKIGTTADAVNPFVDPEGYQRYVADRERAFLAEWEKQKAER